MLHDGPLSALGALQPDPRVLAAAVAAHAAPLAAALAAAPLAAAGAAATLATAALASAIAASAVAAPAPAGLSLESTAVFAPDAPSVPTC